MKTAWTYLRVSSASQTRRAESEEGFSIEAQREACARKAKELEADVAREYVVRGKTGTEANAVLDELLTDLGNGAPDYVVVYKLDRLARDRRIDVETAFAIRTSGAQLVSVLEQIDETPAGQLLHGVLASVNEFYSRDMVQRILDGSTRKAKDGGTPIRAPLGYLNKQRIEGRNDIRWVEVDEERAPLVQWAFTAYATGEYTLEQLVEEMYERGLRSRPTNSKPPGKVGRSTIARMLQNPYYVGTVRYRGNEYEGKHPTFIPRPIYDQVQAVLATHNLAGDKHWRHGHYLKGTVFCRYCGSRLRFTQVRGRRGGTYRYFMCGGRHQGKKCRLPYLPEHDVEEAVARYYGETVKFNAEQVTELEGKLVKLFPPLEAHHRREADRQRRRLQRVLLKQKKLLDRHLDEDITAELHREKQAELKAELADAEDALAKAERALGKAETGVALARQLLVDSAAAYRRVDDFTRRRWNQTFFRRLFLNPEGVVGAELTDSFGDLLSEQLARDVDKLTARLPASLGRGSSVERIVEPVGLEPTPFAMPSRRSPS